MHPPKTAQFTAIFILAAGITATGLLIPRHHSFMLGFAYFTSFMGYFWICYKPISHRALFVFGILLRLMMFLSLPMLSDDLYRFLWDGSLLKSGLNPYTILPTDVSGMDSLYPLLNSPGYYTIYPPFNQILFWLSVSISDQWLASANVIRSFLLLADIGSFLLLRKLLISARKPASLALWFWLNPLIILEFTGNLHFEGIVIFFLLLFIDQYSKKNWLAGGSLGMAIGTKLLPLIFLPAVLFQKRIQKSVLIILLAIGIPALSFVPFVSMELVNGFTNSLNLYFQKFEFNASIYFLAREVGYWISGYNMIALIGPLLSILTFVSIIVLAFWSSKKSWPISQTMLFTLFIYLSFTTTVHPWYVLALIPLGILSGYYFPIVWSLMIFVTYFGYTATGFELSTGWIVVEYMVVWSALIIDTKKKYFEVRL